MVVMSTSHTTQPPHVLSMYRKMMERAREIKAPTMMMVYDYSREKE
jgi:hypothetical protein